VLAELHVQALAEDHHERLAGGVVGCARPALSGSQAGYQQEAATAAIGQPLAEVVGEIEMRECVESQHAVEALAVVLEHVLEEAQRSSSI